MLPLNLSDTAATSQDGSSLDLSHPSRVGSAIFRMQVAEACDGDLANKYSDLTCDKNLADLLREDLARRELLTKQSNNPDGGE